MILTTGDIWSLIHFVLTLFGFLVTLFVMSAIGQMLIDQVSFNLCGTKLFNSSEYRKCNSLRDIIVDWVRCSLKIASLYIGTFVLKKDVSHHLPARSRPDDYFEI